MAFGALDQMSRDERAQIAVAVGLGVVIIGVAWYATSGGKWRGAFSTPDYGVTINPTCSDWEVTDDGRLQRAFGRFVDDQIAYGNIDPAQIAEGFLQLVSGGSCGTRIGVKTKTPKEALLLYVIYRDVLQELVIQQQLTQQMYLAKLTAGESWALEQGVNIDVLENVDELVRES